MAKCCPLALFGLMLFLASCQKPAGPAEKPSDILPPSEEEQPETTSLPSLISIEISAVTWNSASICVVWDDGGAPLLEQGLLLAKREEDLSSAQAIHSQSLPVYQLALLPANTKHFVKAYASNANGTVFSEALAFCTDRESVDLGLPSGVRWATCNLGASSPEDYGKYYAWGETESKTIYSWGTYKFYNEQTELLSKYCTRSENGTKDNLLTLEPADDAARVKWGRGWRIPSAAECQELMESCEWTWTTLNGIGGYRVTGPNGGSIFLPAGGYRDDFAQKFDPYIGYYWSSSLHGDYPLYASFLFFHSDQITMYDYYRHDGLSIRPVTEVE